MGKLSNLSEPVSCSRVGNNDSSCLRPLWGLAKPSSLRGPLQDPLLILGRNIYIFTCWPPPNTYSQYSFSIILYSSLRKNTNFLPKFILKLVANILSSSRPEIPKHFFDNSPYLWILKHSLTTFPTRDFLLPQLAPLSRLFPSMSAKEHSRSCWN